MSEYTRSEERAYVRPLRAFGEPNLETIHGPAMANHPSNGAPLDAGATDGGEGTDTTPTPNERVKFNPAVFSLLVLAAGALIVSTGVALVLSVGFGLITLGVLVFAVGFMTALSN